MAAGCDANATCSEQGSCSCAAPFVGDGLSCSLPLGEGCTQNSDCQSNHCVDNICCDVAACGTCERCDGAGSCRAVTAYRDLDTCTGRSSCNAQGRCVRDLGEACDNDTQCESGSCVDGVCCDGSCGTCESCAVESLVGRCSPLVDADDPGECAITRTCGRRATCLTIDQQPASPATDSRVIFGNGRGGREEAGQIVTIGRSGTLMEVRVAAHCDEPSVSIYVDLEGATPDDQASGALLATATGFSADELGQLIGFQLDTPVVVTVGQRIAIIISAPNATELCEAAASSVDVYSGGGALWHDDNQHASGEHSYNDFDLAFQTLMQ
jgi:hypothetical protein